MHGPWPIPEGRTVDVPMGYAAFPKEIIRPPRSIAARFYTDIRRWSAMPRGGHFAAMEQPDLLAHEIREFFRPLRSLCYPPTDVAHGGPVPTKVLTCLVSSSSPGLARRSTSERAA